VLDLNGGETFRESGDIAADIKLRAREHTEHEGKTTQKGAVKRLKLRKGFDLARTVDLHIAHRLCERAPSPKASGRQ
jgi:hypothetical protein